MNGCNTSSPNYADKACPIVLRYRQQLEILAFEHPVAGLQLVKGTVEPGESTAAAAVRELFEEAGLHGRVTGDLGTWRAPVTEQLWALHVCQVTGELPNTWAHRTDDDGGRVFRFFWHPLASQPSAAWHEIFVAVLAVIQARVSGML